MIIAFARAAHGADASALFADGERAFAAGEYAEALRLFTAAREAGSTGPSSYYNIGVCQYRLRQFDAAEATFAMLADEFPAMRELAEYNRGLALRAGGNLAGARVAFERARQSTDEKIVALANGQLADLGPRVVADEARWTGYFASALGFDDNVALLNELVLASSEASSPLAEVLGVVTRDFGSRPLRFDASGYAVHYPDVGDFDQTALRLSLEGELSFGRWSLFVGPTLGRTTLNGEGFEELAGADMRLRRGFGDGFVFEARAVYDDTSAADSQFAYLDGWHRLLRLSVQHTGTARVRAAYDVERDDRADPGVSPSRERLGIFYQRRLSQTWSADATAAYRTSRYSAASVPREEQLLELTFAARRTLGREWTLGVEYQWFNNDSTVEDFAYDGQRFALGLSRSFYGP
ncbi:MAG TPA: tetratricopeptide repeat protein [Gammaproteobacteria bacterium]|nr:tetratricopeptide repeat protein [Gammaproteobacteria bacterium]